MSISEPDQPTIIVQEDDILPLADAPTPASGPRGMAAIKKGLQAEEAARARTIGLVFFAICGVTMAWAPMLNGEPSLKIPVILCVGQFALTSLALYWITGTPERYTRRVFWLYGASAVLASTMILIYLGPFSPTALAVTLGISFFGQGVDRIGAWVVSCAAIAAYLLVFVLITTGMMSDVGIFRGDEAGMSGRIFMVIMVPMVLFVTLMQARWSRRAVEVALETAVESTIEVGRRGVQLEEAQAELERIAAAGGVLGQMSGKLVGRYKLGKLLGRGGSGEVYDAIDTQGTSELAVKILAANQTDDEEVAIRFEREGKIAIRLASRYIARLHHYGQAPDGTLFIAMERLDGSDLAAILRRQSRLELHVAQGLVHDVCEGISEAHRLGIIHRDIKPHNIFLAKEEAGTKVWKVLDFGVSKLTSSLGTLTHGRVVGTPQYMSPEQARGESVDRRADVYGIGAVLYRVLTGRPPVSGGGPAALFGAAYRRPQRPRLVAPEIDSDLEAVIALALAPRPEDRFASVAQLGTAFDQAILRQLPDGLRKQARRVPWRDADA